MSIVFANLKYWTQYLVGDPQMSTYSYDMYVDALNFACLELAKKTGCTYKETGSLTPDVSGFVSIPSTYIRIQRVYHMAGGTVQTQMVESTMSFESMKSNTWMSLAGTPKRWVLFSGAKIKLTPSPSPAYTAIVGFVDSPTQFTYTKVAATDDAQVPDPLIPPAYLEFLKYAACAWLLLLDGDGQAVQLADSHMRKFNDLVGYADPVLEAKMNQTRTQAEREM